MGTGADGFIRRAARVAAIYIVFGALWILLSDKVVNLWSSDPATVEWLQRTKGLAYIVITGILVLVATHHVLVEQYNLSRRADHNERRFKTTFDFAGVGIGLLSPAGRWLRANPKLCQMLGYDEAELQSKSYIDVCHPNDCDRSRAHFEASLAGTECGRAIEKRYVRKDGTTCWVMSTVAPAISQERDATDTEYLIAVEEDITDRKRIEEERDRLESEFLQAQKMEAVGRLAGGIAHDFNNLLSVITGYSETAMADLGPEHRVYPDLQQVQQAAERSAALTRQLLAFARKEMVAPKNINLNETIRASEKLILRILGPSIALHTDLAPDLFNLFMDPSQVDQVLMNLAVNSRDAIHGPGRVWIETHSATIKDAMAAGDVQAPPGDYVCLTYRDDGCGMDAETRARAFEPFFTTKPIGKGTGLGLATVFGIVKQNRGFIELQSSPGEGVAFQIYFPRNDKGKVDLIRESIPVPGGTETVLIVEDEPQILDLCKRVLLTRGYNVLAFDDPRRALQAAEQYAGTIDLLVTDFVMPGMDGAALANALLVNRPMLHVICVSGHVTQPMECMEGLPLHTRYLQKPISPSALLREIYSILHGNADQTA